MSRRSLTGGTGDVKPQILTASISGVAIDDYGVTTINLPVPRIGQSKGRATIFEVLRVYYFMAVEDQGDTGARKFAYLTTSTTHTSAESTSVAKMAVDYSEPQTLAYIEKSTTTTTEGAFTLTMPHTVDLTDNAGNGVLIATDTLSFVCGDVGGSTTSTYAVKILYRTVNVGINEYVGIVQSQQ